MEGILFLTNEIGIALSQARQQVSGLQQALLAKDDEVNAMREELREAQQRNRDLMEAQGE